MEVEEFIILLIGLDNSITLIIYKSTIEISDIRYKMKRRVSLEVLSLAHEMCHEMVVS